MVSPLDAAKDSYILSAQAALFDGRTVIFASPYKDTMSPMTKARVINLSRPPAFFKLSNRSTPNRESERRGLEIMYERVQHTSHLQLQFMHNGSFQLKDCSTAQDPGAGGHPAHSRRSRYVSTAGEEGGSKHGRKNDLPEQPIFGTMASMRRSLFTGE